MRVVRTASQPAWHECPDVVRNVLANLTSVRDSLNCDRVCRSWLANQARILASVSIRAGSLEQREWLQRNVLRVAHLVIEGDCPECIPRSVLSRLCMHKSLISLSIKECSQLTALPDCISQLQQLQRLQLCNCCRLRALPEVLGSLKALQQLEISAPFTEVGAVKMVGIRARNGFIQHQQQMLHHVSPWRQLAWLITALRAYCRTVLGNHPTWEKSLFPVVCLLQCINLNKYEVGTPCQVLKQHFTAD